MCLAPWIYGTKQSPSSLCQSSGSHLGCVPEAAVELFRSTDSCTQPLEWLSGPGVQPRERCKFHRWLGQSANTENYSARHSLCYFYAAQAFQYSPLRAHFLAWEKFCDNLLARSPTPWPQDSKEIQSSFHIRLRLDTAKLDKGDRKMRWLGTPSMSPLNGLNLK